MPEAPSIRMLREKTERFAGQRILRVESNSKVDL
jgi:hypothetical protein